MFAITLLRATRQTVDSNAGITMDAQWMIFWQMVEACVAVIVVSLTSFRSLYGIKTLKREKKNKKGNEIWLSSYRRNISNRGKQQQIDELGDPSPSGSESHRLPIIAGGTLPGIRTVISACRKPTRGFTKRSKLLSLDEVQKDYEEPDVIKVVVDIDTHESIKNYV